MSFFLKACIALVVLFALANATVHHRHHKQGSLQQPRSTHDEPREALTELVETHISGKITCNGRGLDWVRPYLHSPYFPRTIINISPSMDGGKYYLTTGTLFDTRGSVELMVRHQCRIEGLRPMEKCAVPYYTTNIRIQLDKSVTEIKRDLELFDMASDSSSDCLY